MMFAIFATIPGVNFIFNPLFWMFKIAKFLYSDLPALKKPGVVSKIVRIMIVGAILGEIPFVPADPIANIMINRVVKNASASPAAGQKSS
jgi:hypothetical protein